MQVLTISNTACIMSVTICTKNYRNVSALKFIPALAKPYRSAIPKALSFFLFFKCFRGFS